jgi:hypothetical protein
MISAHRLVVPALTLVLFLAACGSDEKEASQNAEGKANGGALSDQIVVDPKLAGQSAAPGGELPPEARTPNAIAAAKADALKVAGGLIRPAPAAQAIGAGSKAVTPAQIAASAAGLGSACPDKIEYAGNWATRLPAPLSVYPGGQVVEAAGTDRDGCKLRIVNFVTPVTVKDVVDFYNTRVNSAGFNAEHRVDGKEHVLSGKKGTAAYVVFARPLENGLTDVDIVANGS